MQQNTGQPQPTSQSQYLNRLLCTVYEVAKNAHGNMENEDYVRISAKRIRLKMKMHVNRFHEMQGKLK